MTVKPLTFQELILKLQDFWAAQGCVLQQPLDVEVGAGTMSPETFFASSTQALPCCLRAALAPSRRRTLWRKSQSSLQAHPVSGHPQSPARERAGAYLQSLKAIGIDLARHDIKFEEDNWELHPRRLGSRLAGHA